MPVRIRSWRRPWLRALALATAVVVVPLPVLAADPSLPQPHSAPLPIGGLIRQAVATLPPAALCASDVRAPAPAPAGASARAPALASASAQASASAPEKAGGEKPTRWSFFRTPAGFAVMATVAVGLTLPCQIQ